MSFLRDSLPVYGLDHQLIYYAPLSTVPRLIESGRARPCGTAARMRGLVAMCDTEELLCAARPPRGRPDTNTLESDTNPRGVWTFRKQYAPS